LFVKFVFHGFNHFIQLNSSLQGKADFRFSLKILRSSGKINAMKLNMAQQRSQR